MKSTPTQSARAASMLALAIATSQALAGDPYATEVVSYDPGSTHATTFAGVPYTDSLAALGEPERMTGEGVWPGAVTMFNAPFMTNEIVSIGEGGHLTLKTGRPITNDPSHPYGLDLIVFAHPGFIDADWPNGQMGNPAALFSNDDAIVEVSDDGFTFYPVGSALGQGLFPTQGYLDVGPNDASPGAVPLDFFQPMSPALTLSSFNGLTYAQALALYGTSGGGTAIDIASTGLTSAQYVRFRVQDDGNATVGLNFELDAVTVVPEPSTIILAVLAALACFRASPFRRR
jgi:hypothetical protein